MNTCGILYRNGDPIASDSRGCVLPYGHDDAHCFKDYKNNKWYRWETDYRCTSASDDSDDWDLVIWEIRPPISDSTDITYYARFRDHHQDLTEIYDMVDNGDYAHARYLIEQLEYRMGGSFPDLQEMKVLLDRLELVNGVRLEDVEN